MVNPLVEGEASASDNASPDTGSGRSRSSSRPSFTDYWRRTKQAAGQSITFVSSNPEQASGPSSKNSQQQQQQEEDDTNIRAKSQARRAQVRKAQIQHRQRKANYTKQLEMDVARLRDLIEQTEHESLTLKTENEAIRFRLQTHVPATSSAPSKCISETALHYLAAPPATRHPEPEYTVNFLTGSESLDTPLFQVRRATTPWSAAQGLESSAAATATVVPGTTASGGTTNYNAAEFTEAETDHAINFILGLEHICWNHFHPSYYTHENYDPEANEHGHSLMASAIALQNAPPETWQRLASEKEEHKRRVTAAQAIDSSTNPTPDLNTNPIPNPDPDPSIIASWQLPPSPQGLNLTLSNLRSLAATLNPAGDDGSELAPVQAWFEIARLYGSEVVRDPDRMDRLRAELERDVDCLHFGAVIQRAAFEEVLEKVLGPVPALVVV